MLRLGLTVLILYGCYFQTFAQCVVSKDDKGRVVTTCQVYLRDNGGMETGNHVQVVYHGTEYFTFPIMQPGTVLLGGKEIPCELAYSVASNEVSYHLLYSTTIERVQPDAFTINGQRFIRQPINDRTRYESYFMVLKDGKTKLLKNIKSELRVGKGDNGYAKADEFQGHYNIQENYYIKKGNAFPEAIKLTGKSVLTVLKDQSARLSSRVESGKMSTEAIIEVLKYYDTLNPNEQVLSNELTTKPALSRDLLFNQVIHNKISYPGQARSERVYGRVYAGFEIDKQGKIQNIVLLSPQNIGFGFDYAVTQALKKLPVLSPEYEGKYALPVAFTFTSPSKNQADQVPLNKLPADRLTERTELEEITVSVPVGESYTQRPEGREVWGYYK